VEKSQISQENRGIQSWCAVLFRKIMKRFSSGFNTYSKEIRMVSRSKPISCERRYAGVRLGGLLSITPDESAVTIENLRYRTRQRSPAERLSAKPAGKGSGRASVGCSIPHYLNFNLPMWPQKALNGIISPITKTTPSTMMSQLTRLGCKAEFHCQSFSR